MIGREALGAEARRRKRLGKRHAEVYRLSHIISKR